MGTTREEIRLPKFRNTPNFLIPVYCLLSTLIGYALSGPVTQQSAINETLKLCNERPLECKFKYDIIRYNQTGQIPYQQEVKKK
jgi:hypothetical protein